MKRLERNTEIRTKKIFIHHKNFSLFNEEEGIQYGDLECPWDDFVLRDLMIFYGESFKSEFDYVISMDFDDLYCYLEFDEEVHLQDAYDKIKLDGGVNTGRQYSIHYECLENRRKVNRALFEPEARWTNMRSVQYKF